MIWFVWACTLLAVLLIPLANRLVDRLPDHQRLGGPPRCLDCQQPLPRQPLMPDQPCPHCRSLPGGRPLLLALGLVGLVGLAGWRWSDPWQAGAGLLALWVLWLLFWTDLETLRLPDALTWPLAATGVAANILLTLLHAPSWTSPSASLLGLVLGYFGLWAFAWGWRWWRGETGMGGGDIKLFAAVGAWLGPSALPGVLMLAAAGASLVAIWLLLRGVNRAAVLPFGPALALAGGWALLGGWIAFGA